MKLTSHCPSPLSLEATSTEILGGGGASKLFYYHFMAQDEIRNDNEKGELPDE